MVAAKLGKPAWIVRTYTGFNDPVASNRRFRDNLARGQTGLSIAFDLPTQCGYDPDHPAARFDVGRAGVSVAHLGDLDTLLDGIDLAQANTSMTINATAPWLYALYLALAERRGVAKEALRGTTQNDLLKEFVARGTYVFDPGTSLRLSADLVATAAQWTPRWNGTNCCGYHLMESGAGPADEVGWALGGALLLLDHVRPQLAPTDFARVVDAVSFFVNSGLELVPEICKIRAYFQLWPELCHERYGLRPKFRAGCQVRSLTLSAQQPEVNIVRIALEALPVLLSASARVGALQLPGFREALALPDAAEQTLSLRTQQVLMHETGLADWPDLFEGSQVIEAETARLKDQARAIALHCLDLGYQGTIEALCRALARKMAEWQAAVATGDKAWVGVNCFTDAVPLVQAPVGGDDPATATDLAADRARELAVWRERRDGTAWQKARVELLAAMRANISIMPASVAFAHAGGTTGEWTDALLEVAGPRWHAPLGVDGLSAAGPLLTPSAAACTPKVRVVLCKAGLDGHVNALRLLALALRQAGAEVVWLGPGQSPDAVAATVVAEDADVVGVSSLSGGHLGFASALLSALQTRGAVDVPVVVGGTVSDADRTSLRALGVREVVTVADGDLAAAAATVLRAAQLHNML
jgi:(2R)-ethylmalonyl-CoA mutase